MRLTFYGAADSVTGSCHLLETNTARILLDCGFFLGGELTDRNRESFPFNPEEIDFLLLSHAHLDHCGRIPLLVKHGFRGSIVSTLATYDLARMIMLDAAGIQEEEARRQSRKNKRLGKPEVEPLYNVEDVLDCLDYFDTFTTYDEPVALNDHITVTYRDAGHILGSAFIEIHEREGRRRRSTTRRITYSGDLGNLDKPLIRDPQTPSETDFAILEATYGDRNHKPFDDSVEELLKIITETLARGGNVLIPAFALGRSQELLYILHDFYRAGNLPDCTIYLDSPMAINATRIYAKHGDCYDEDAIELQERGENPFQFPPLRYTRHADDSREINTHRSGAIIIAGSGMCTGGRILHHLKHNLWRPECSVVFIGYAAQDTLARRIIEGNPFVSIHNERVDVKAHIHTVGGFSAHAGQQTLIQWADALGDPERIFLVHGEDKSVEALAHQLDEGLGLEVYNPKHHESVDL